MAAVARRQVLDLGELDADRCASLLSVNSGAAPARCSRVWKYIRLPIRADLPDGKVTYVHRALWPALLGVAAAGRGEHRVDYPAMLYRFRRTDGGELDMHKPGRDGAPTVA